MKSYSKINIFLKITGTRGEYHKISSRFILFKDLYDEIEFLPAKKFEINPHIENNIILKAIDVLKDFGYENWIKDFFSHHKIIIKKNIPFGSGLGGASSNAASFLKLCQKELKIQNIFEIGGKIGSDVNFFLSEFESANVSGVGEVVEEFKDEIPKINLIKTNILCSTPKVYSCFRENFMNKIDKNLISNFEKKTSLELLNSFSNYELNDLLLPCEKLYNIKAGNKFLSGSGSTMFELGVNNANSYK